MSEIAKGLEIAKVFLTECAAMRFSLGPLHKEEVALLNSVIYNLARSGAFSVVQVSDTS